MKKIFKKIKDKISINYDIKTFKMEDNFVFSFIDGLSFVNNKINYLEIGSGLCRFPLLIKNRYKKFNIKCLEKNSDLVNLGIKNSLDIVCGDVIKMDFDNQEFNIIHCSHVIEHLDYQGITESLSEMFRVLKSGGYLILRSPLMYPGFYFDIDHIRPYPPEAILNYFNNTQQQRVGGCDILEVSRWYRKESFLFYNSNKNIIKIINFLFKLFWLFVGFPKSKPNGYILIIQKI